MGWALWPLAWACLATAQEPPPDTLPPGLSQVVRDTVHAPLDQRIGHISAWLRGIPYRDDSHGEGAGHDPDPIARYDAFDCLTYVEEVLALAWGSSEAGAAAVRADLRWRNGQPSYSQRHHFMELQWLPNAVAHGWLTEVTSSYGDTTTFEAEVTAQTWQQWSGTKRFAMPQDQLPTGTMRLDVLSLDTAEAIAQTIAPGTILLTVRTPRKGVPLWITHLGLVVRDDQGATVVRHASRMASARKVTDHPIGWYVRHLRTYTNWPAAGIALFAPQEQGPTSAAARGV